MKTRWLTVFLCICAAIQFYPAVSAAAPAGSGSRYSLAVIPRLPPVTMYADWYPLVERLSKDTGLALKLKVYESMDAFEEDLRKGGPDFVFVNPTQAVIAHLSHGYIPLVRGKHKISGVAFVKKDSPFNSLQDLNGKEIALAGRKNLCSLLVRDAMQSGKGKVDYIPVYVGSSANILKSVMLDKTAAGVTLDVELAKYPADMTEQVRVLFSSTPTAPHPLAAHPRVATQARKALVDAVLRLGGDKDGLAMLKTVGLNGPVRADYAKDYKPLENIDLKRLTAGE